MQFSLCSFDTDSNKPGIFIRTKDDIPIINNLGGSAGIGIQG